MPVPYTELVEDSGSDGQYSASTESGDLLFRMINAEDETGSPSSESEQDIEGHWYNDPLIMHTGLLSLMCPSERAVQLVEDPEVEDASEPVERRVTIVRPPRYNPYWDDPSEGMSDYSQPSYIAARYENSEDSIYDGWTSDAMVRFAAHYIYEDMQREAEEERNAVAEAQRNNPGRLLSSRELAERLYGSEPWYLSNSDVSVGATSSIRRRRARMPPVSAAAAAAAASSSSDESESVRTRSLFPRRRRRRRRVTEGGSTAADESDADDEDEGGEEDEEGGEEDEYRSTYTSNNSEGRRTPLDWSEPEGYNETEEMAKSNKGGADCNNNDKDEREEVAPTTTRNSAGGEMQEDGKEGSIFSGFKRRAQGGGEEEEGGGDAGQPPDKMPKMNS